MLLKQMNEVVKNLFYTVPNLAGVVEILKKNKTREEKKVNHTSINVSWVTNDDKVRCVNDYMINRAGDTKMRGWATIYIQVISW
ncbi:MAG: hypothetical protein CM15mV8_2060 [Caudoviricetes sp.]|nr:MAG: hypothetical protein CM15mV8_2060 [Caudoviricetes sp.]